MDANKCLITGCEGFVGSHLAEFLLEKGISVYGMVYGSTENIDHLEKKITILKCDLNDGRQVENIINEVVPDYVFHLAAQSFVTVSWENPEGTLRTNILGTYHLLESIRKLGIDPLIEIIGSSAVYGPCTKDEMPLKEDREFRPTSMYAVSKVSEESLGYFYWQGCGLRVIIIRPFNMTGPRKTLDACSDFSKGIIEVEKGLKDILEVGNLDTVRDFTDGRDAVKALWILAEKGKVGEVYNLCSGNPQKIGDILKKLTSISGIKADRIKQSKEKMRKVDDPIYIGDNAKLSGLGWLPRISMETTLEDMLDYWRNVL
ncbi:NAD-dependent glucose-6-phosphate dehydrogenase [uncultured archaeon]|nr:NAD-dependent glucose-6-phosphate dehydrogenase [uncultured archaeon]